MAGAAQTPIRRDPKVLIIFPGLMLAMMLAALDGTIVATALPTIVNDLGGLQNLSLVVTAYLLGSCVSTPIYGKIGDQFGRKRLFQGAILLFLVGSALCGAAQSMTALVLFRALQGLGAGGLLVNSQAIIGELVPPAERGNYQGYLQSVYALATVAGPLLGGILTEHLGWRWVFYVNLPVGVAALAVIGIVLKLPARTRDRPRVDWSGAVLLAGAATCLILVTSSSGHRFGWMSVPAISLFFGTAVLTAGFLLAERRAAEPLIPLQLFQHRGFRRTMPLTFFVGFLMLGVTTFNPLYQQIVAGSAPTLAGLQLAPLTLVMMGTSVLVGRAVSRTGRYRRFPIAGACLLVVAMGLLVGLGVDTPYWFQLIGLATAGLGFGLINTVLLISAQNSVGPEDIGVATSTNTFSRVIGSSVGVAVFGAVFAAQLGASLARGVPPSVVGTPSGEITVSRGEIDALAAPVRDAVREAFSGSLRSVFVCALVVAALCLVLTLRIPEFPLRRRHTVEEPSVEVVETAELGDASAPDAPTGADEDRRCTRGLEAGP